jgi:hypothetical protein
MITLMLKINSNNDPKSVDANKGDNTNLESRLRCNREEERVEG